MGLSTAQGQWVNAKINGKFGQKVYQWKYGIQSFWMCLAPSLLDNVKGYTLYFDFKVISEAHGDRTSRSGCSMIVLGSDGKGVELAFWTKEVGSQ